MGARQGRIAVAGVVAAAVLALAWVVIAPRLAGGVGADTPGVLAAWLAICCGPVLLLAVACALLPMHRRGARRALVAGVVATSGFWAFFHGVTWWETARYPTGGANIGLGLLMLVSPAAVLVAMALAYALGRRD